MGDTFRAPPGRLDVVVAARLGLPRAEVQRAIAEGRVLVDGAPRPKAHRLRGGEVVDAGVRSPAGLDADELGVPVLYEDEHLLVVSKPAGVLSHPTPTRRTGTLVNRLLALGVPLSRAGGPDRPGIVHRLDSGTSGLMVVAKDDEAHAAISSMFRRHMVERTYLALVRGRVEHDRFVVRAPLGRRGARIVVRAVTGRDAATEVGVKERLATATLLEVRPRTGRTHQIRVHLAAIGHPVLGDRTYGGGGEPSGRLGLSRPFLHSWRIAFDHPLSRTRVSVEEQLPADLEEALHRARGA